MSRISWKIVSCFSFAVLLSACGGDGENGAQGDVNTGGVDTGGSTGGSGGGGVIVKPQTNVERALLSGDALLVKDAKEYAQHSEKLLEGYQNQFNQIKRSLNGDTNSLYWDPSHDAAIMSPTYGFNDSILKTNKALQSGYADQQLTLGIAGEYGVSGRYVALGSNPFRTSLRSPSSINSEMEQWSENLWTWLNGQGITKTTNIVLAHLDQSYYFPDESATREWIDKRFNEVVTVNQVGACDGELLLNCVEARPNVLVLSQHLTDEQDLPAIEVALRRALELEIPIFYLHLNGHMMPLGDLVFNLLNIKYVGDNYWRKLGISDWSPSELIDHVPAEISQQQALLEKLADDTFSIDLSLCDDKSCPAEANMDEFYQPANSIREHLKSLDERGTELFNTDQYEYEKLLVLTADYYRNKVSFPMDKLNTERVEFLRSYYADYAQYNSRTLNYAQPDMGNFSRSHFEERVERISKTVTLESKRNFRSAGVYALPGESLVVTRLDNEPVTTKIVINTLRSGATHEFNDHAYSRPKLVTSYAYEVKPRETIRLTSSYGGPIQVHFSANNYDVSLKFEGVAQHPVWRSREDNQTFVKQLNANLFDWAELVTPGFEVHSKSEKMKESISAPEWEQPEDMALATERYVHNLPHALAGFQGPGIDSIEDIHHYAINKGWEVETIDVVKHMNADQANCGYGCSGNPYDAYWSFHPLGHGDLHELGHGLEKGRFRFAGWDGHSTTNYYSYYSKSRYFAETGKVSACQSLDFKSQYELLQTSRQQADPHAFMAAQGQTSWSWGARIFIQIMMQAQSQGVINNGWHLLGRLHILEREFNRLRADETRWLTYRDNIGFSSYSRDEANTISNDDWLLIAFSIITERDMRDYLDMWGFSFSDKAKSEVSAKSLSPMPLSYFASSNTGYCLDEFAQRETPVDGATSWPL